MAPKIFQESKTTLRLSKYGLPILVVTALALLSTLATFGITFYPAKARFDHTQALYEAALHTQQQTQTAKHTQEILASTWKALPQYREFTDLSLEIANLADRNHVKVPGMGYDFKSLPNRLGTKGTFSFEAEGDYEAIRKFIYELEKRWPYLFIEKLSVEGSKKKQEGVIFKLTVSTFLKTSPDSLQSKSI
ncbi:MAG: GspMb/PilO family protein [Nitrospirales bacterium]